MILKQISLSELTPYDKNPRLNDDAVPKVAESIQQFGFKVPIVIDSNNVIVAGHTRYKAAQSLGLQSVPCIVADDLTPEQIRAFRLADNKVAEFAEWDFDALNEELELLTDFDMGAFGFDELAEDNTLEDYTENPLPELEEDSRSQLGECYQLGDHVLLCGDATKENDVKRLMDGVLADFWLTDPPYNVDYEGGNGLKITNDSMSDDAFKLFLMNAFHCASSSLKDGAAFYVFHADRESINFRSSLLENDFKISQGLIWKKNQFTLGRQDFQWVHEPVLYGWKEGAAHQWYSDCSQSTVFEFDRPKANDVHPTMKPVDMLSYLLKCSSKQGDIVLDTFGGSGSTLIACELTGRTCRMMELDPRYCDVIRKRYAELVYGAGCDWVALTPRVV